MRIEIMDFYPLERDEKKDFLSGTLKVNILDVGIRILGVFISKKKQYWHVSLPGRIGIHHKTGEQVRYPYIAFEDDDKHNELYHAIREKGREFIEKRLADKENPLIFPEKKRKSQIGQKSKPAKIKNFNDNSKVVVEADIIENLKDIVREDVEAKLNLEPKKTACETKQKIIQPITAKEWVDPPKRNVAYKKVR